MNPIFLATSTTQAQTPATNNNAEREAHTRQLFLRLRSLDKSESPTDQREAERLVEQIAAYNDKLCTVAALRLLQQNKRIKLNTQDFEDVIQEARIGLIKAIHRFDPFKSTAFVTYAFPLITGEMRHFLRDRFHMIRESSYSQEQRKRDGVAPSISTFCAGLPGQNTTHEKDGEAFNFHDYLLLGEEPDFAQEVDHRLSVESEIGKLRKSRNRVASSRGDAVEMHLQGATLQETATKLGCSISNAKALVTSGMAAMNGALDE
jgi:RNA polymerase sigma factor (sigma-70 family)